MLLHTVNISGEYEEISQLLFVIQVEEQLCQAEPDDSTFVLEKTEIQLGSIGGDSASVHQEDLLEGDLGLGTAPAITREA